MKKVLEVCVDSLASAVNAVSGGADRLELCSALAVGGLTPCAELLRQIRAVSDIPVRCLMRPRAGDFLYAPEELRLMAAQMKELGRAGSDGFVIGCLSADGRLDREAMAPLIEAAEGRGLSLHRCIDVSAEPEQSYLEAMELGIDTVLSSGAAASCIKGMALIKKLISLRDSHGGPEVLVGAGVNAAVISRFLGEVPGARAFHMSGKRELESGMVFRREGVPMGLPGLDEWHIQQTDPEAVRAARLVLYG